MPEPGALPRNPIHSLEALKDRIIAALDTCNLNEATKGMWRSDAKEMYYLLVLADQTLTHGKDPAKAQAVLQGAESRFEQVGSELRALGEPGLALEEELKQTFAACRTYLLERIPPQAQERLEPPARVIKKSDEEYALPCSVCGKIAVAVHPPGETEKILKGVICSGITRSLGLKIDDQPKILGWLAHGDLASLHSYMDKDEDIDGGLDAYCPQCDRIYCYIHYNVRREWDEGFYDCSHGTCPQGHTRLIDD
jgi:hypothetical protein